jgi:hypothetical protein
MGVGDIPKSIYTEGCISLAIHAYIKTSRATPVRYGLGYEVAITVGEGIE